MPRSTGRRRAAALLTAVVTLTGLLVPGVGTPAADAGTTGAATHTTGTRTAARAVATAKPKTTVLTVLVVPAYWDKNIDTHASSTALIARTNKWFAAVSGGRFRLKATIAPSMKVKKGCGPVVSRATAAAARHGYGLTRYSLVMVLAPTCSNSGGAEEATSQFSRQPHTLAVYGTRGRSQYTVIHQFGHVLGLDDSASLWCKKDGRMVTIAADRYCSQASFTTLDAAVMGHSSSARYADPVGGFSAPDLTRLGWLPRSQVVNRSSGTSTVTLKPLSRTSGTRALVVKADKGTTYWLEYRTRAGVDAQVRPETVGVIVRRVSAQVNRVYTADHVQTIDMPSQAGTGQGLGALQSGSSWTAPEGVRFSVVSASSTGARVTVRFRAPRPAAPAAPTVTAFGGDGTIPMSWKRADDRGRPVSEYHVELLGAHGDLLQQFIAVPWLPRRWAFEGVNGAAYTVRVRALNDIGWSAWRSVRVVPRAPLPVIRLVDPPTGSVDARYVELKVRPVPGTYSSAPTSVTFYPGGVAGARQPDGSWTGMVDLAQGTGAPNQDLVASATDAKGRTSGVHVTVAVPPRLAPPTFARVDPSDTWSSGPLTVKIAATPDRLTGAPPQHAGVIIGNQYVEVGPQNDWTATFGDEARSHLSAGHPAEIIAWTTLDRTNPTDAISSNIARYRITIG